MSENGRLFGVVDPDPERHPRRPEKDPVRGLANWLQTLPVDARRQIRQIRADHVAALAGRGPRRCEVVGCGEAAAHQHHTAPREMFGGVAELYPLQWLCKTHHELWHATVNAWAESRGGVRL